MQVARARLALIRDLPLNGGQSTAQAGYGDHVRRIDTEHTAEPDDGNTLGGRGWDDGAGAARSGGIFPMKRNHSQPLILLILLALVLLTGAGRRKGRQGARPTPPLRSRSCWGRRTRRWLPGPVQSGPALTGTLAAERQAAIRAQIAGSVLTVTAEPGQAVRRGETLARLDSAALPTPTTRPARR